VHETIARVAIELVDLQAANVALSAEKVRLSEREDGDALRHFGRHHF
jgi:hypothetical protein